MKQKSKPDLLKCPCCNQRRTKDECSVFAAQCANEVPKQHYVSWKGKFVLDEQSTYWTDAIAGTNRNWACDNCLQQERAVRAHPRLQQFCDFTPHFTFFDKRSACRDCGQEFIFTKGEQQFWFENLKFWVQVKKVRCAKCLAIKKRQKKLSYLLTNYDYRDLTKLAEIIAIYLEREEIQRAKHILTLTKKNYLPTDPQVQRLLELSAKITLHCAGLPAPTPANG
ncbi:MAG: zinc-ribbon domain containing protein [Janthinobacterium lividum]